jgi:HK97 family phage major capsid protein|nr:MAG TPA: major capsid protein [Caudoviricetes sp.]
MNFYQIKKNTMDMADEAKQANEKLNEMLANPQVTTEDIKAQQKVVDAAQERYDVAKEQMDKAEAQEKLNLKPVKEKAQLSPKEKRDEAFATLVRNTMAKEAVGADIYQALGDEDTTGGNKFLPKTVSTDIISEPVENNPLRDISTVTQIPNLEIPRLTFNLDDDSFIQDKETAKEIEAKGTTVQFTRNKFKVMVGMSETVLLGSDANLTAYVEQGLQNGVTVKERSVAFNPAPSKENEKHMSFYDPSNNIKTVNGADLYEAITNAVADLHEAYRENATIVMAYKDYLKIIRTLANGSATLYGAQPSQVLGKPVVFTDAAVKPIVGDFSYSQYNYDINTLYDQDKDVKTGINYFVVTAWMDHQIKLSSAFRIADVAPSK